MAPHAGFDPKTHLLKLGTNAKAGTGTAGAVVRVNENRNGRVDAEQRRYLAQSLFDIRPIVTREQADGVLSARHPHRRNGCRAHEAAAPQSKVKFHSAAAGDDRALQV